MIDFSNTQEDKFLHICTDLHALIDAVLDIYDLVENSDHVEHELTEVQIRIAEIYEFLIWIAKIKQLTND